MTYGIVSYKDYGNNVQNLSQTMLGGRVFVKSINQAYTTSIVDIPIPNVSSHTYLKFYTVQSGSFAVSSYTNNGVATVRLTPRYVSQSQFASGVYILVFATQTTEPDYGILSVNNSGERLVSSIYPVPQFLQKITFSSSGFSGGNWTVGRGTTYHNSTTTTNLGFGRTKIALFTVPDNVADCWYFLDSYVGTGEQTLQIAVEGPAGATYALPEAYIFALDNALPSSDTYGLRIYGPSPNSQLLFDSGHTYLDIKGFNSIIYDTVVNSVTSSIFNTTAGILVPAYQYESIVGRQGQTASDRYLYYGCIKRSGNTLYSKKILVSQGYEDAYYNMTNEYGDTFNTVFAIDISPLGGTGSSGSGGVGSGISAGIILSGGTSTCSYDASIASSCSTSQNFTVSVSGGTGGAITYNWSLINATGFSISGSTTTNSVTVVNSGGGGTYTGTLQCSVNQAGSLTQTPQYSLSHTHTATTAALSGSVTASDQVLSCAYTSGTTCTTGATYTVGTISGGNGNAKTYSWSLVNNTGAFSFTTGTTGTVVGITKTAGAGTYTATVRCTVSQVGSTNLVIDTAVSTSHTAQTGSLVSPMVGVPNTTWTATTTSIDPGGAFAVCRIWMTSDGQIWIDQNGANRNGAPTSAWWSTATYVFNGGVAGIGTSYWVKFTRTAFVGDTTTSNDTTGWMQLSTDRNVEVAAGVGDNSSTTNTATYTIQVASTSTGGSPISTTSGITIRAVAQNTYAGGPVS